MPRCALLLLLSVPSLLFWITSIVLCVAIGVYVGTEDGKYTAMKWHVLSNLEQHIFTCKHQSLQVVSMVSHINDSKFAYFHQISHFFTSANCILILSFHWSVSLMSSIYGYTVPVAIYCLQEHIGKIAENFWP